MPTSLRAHSDHVVVLHHGALLELLFQDHLARHALRCGRRLGGVVAEQIVVRAGAPAAPQRLQGLGVALQRFEEDGVAHLPAGGRLVVQQRCGPWLGRRGLRVRGLLPADALGLHRGEGIFAQAVQEVLLVVELLQSRRFGVLAHREAHASTRRRGGRRCRRASLLQYQDALTDRIDRHVELAKLAQNLHLQRLLLCGFLDCVLRVRCDDEILGWRPVLAEVLQLGLRQIGRRFRLPVLLDEVLELCRPDNLSCRLDAYGMVKSLQSTVSSNPVVTCTAMPLSTLAFASMRIPVRSCASSTTTSVSCDSRRNHRRSPVFGPLFVCVIRWASSPLETKKKDIHQ